MNNLAGNSYEDILKREGGLKKESRVRTIKTARDIRKICVDNDLTVKEAISALDMAKTDIEVSSKCM